MIDIMYVSATEFRTNVGKYLEMAAHEDIYVLKHGFPAVVVSSDRSAKKRVADSLKGSIKYDGDVEKLFEERLKEL
jgi:PHD/YefM family antitoxin component YafN of YafNO toxin-antitoxin module